MIKICNSRVGEGGRSANQTTRRYHVMMTSRMIGSTSSRDVLMTYDWPDERPSISDDIEQSEANSRK